MNNFQEQMRQDYSGAEISFAWVIKERVIHLLFARVDLLPAEFPPETDTPKTTKQLGDGWSIGHQKVYRSIDEALRFYEAIREGQLIDISDSGNPIENAVLTPSRESDNYPALRIDPIREKKGGPPYFAGWQICPRYHEVLVKDPEKVAFVSEKPKAVKAAEWLKLWISFDLGHYSEYWGGAVLVAPNPLFRALDERLWPNPEDTSKEAILVRLHPRKRKSIEGLKVTCSEAETGTSIDVSFVTESAILNFDHRIGKVTTTIHCPERGPL